MSKFKGIVLEKPELCVLCKKNYTTIAVQKGNGPIKPKCAECGDKERADLERKTRSLSRIRIGVWFRL